MEKSIFRSKTFWIATIQAVIGCVAVYSTAYPQLGGLLIAKSLLDIALRYFTSQPVVIG